MRSLLLAAVAVAALSTSALPTPALAAGASAADEDAANIYFSKPGPLPPMPLAYLPLPYAPQNYSILQKREIAHLLYWKTGEGEMQIAEKDIIYKSMLIRIMTCVSSLPRSGDGTGQGTFINYSRAWNCVSIPVPGEAE